MVDMPYQYGVKMTMHIDEALLDRVMKHFGVDSKTKAVELALREMDRKSKLNELLDEGLGLSPAELRNAIDPNYDLEAMRLAETPPPYGSKRTRR
ncbi:MAG TPA: type II toxin-antitoxin system VapB family antitoxin [Candidatus Limnocylindria bacterium]|jgi:Arc/MetJ family transcription regulator|nr:type II toxin-antitoxin system VapB family antitoxin [Candidatus Limnocylindria bacterium]